MASLCPSAAAQLQTSWKLVWHRSGFESLTSALDTLVAAVATWDAAIVQGTCSGQQQDDTFRRSSKPHSSLHKTTAQVTHVAVAGNHSCADAWQRISSTNRGS